MGGPISPDEGWGERKIYKQPIQPLPSPLCLGHNSQNMKLPIFKWEKKGTIFLFFLPFLLSSYQHVQEPYQGDPEGEDWGKKRADLDGEM